MGSNSSYCPSPKTILRPKPKADGTLMFNGNDVTGQFPTKFYCDLKSQQLLHPDEDWCNIYHVCAGPRDNIFICPPGTMFSKQKQGCFDRYTQQECSGTMNYYKPTLKKPSSFLPQAQRPASSNVFSPSINTNNNHKYEYYYPQSKYQMNNMNMNYPNYN